MKQNAIAAGLSLVVGLPLGWIAAMLLTPLLWRLEPILHIELAGHSGPSDWVFYLVWAVVLPTLFFFFRLVVLRKRNDPDRIDPDRGSGKS
jgi:ABC-type antimicrobial peptide transport system permease subunit